MYMKNVGVKQFLNPTTVEAFVFRWQIGHFVPCISCLFARFYLIVFVIYVSIYFIFHKLVFTI